METLRQTLGSRQEYGGQVLFMFEGGLKGVSCGAHLASLFCICTYVVRGLVLSVFECEHQVVEFNFVIMRLDIFWNLTTAHLAGSHVDSVTREFYHYVGQHEQPVYQNQHCQNRVPRRHIQAHYIRTRPLSTGWVTM